MRCSTCSVKVPTPGPYSTNSLQFAQSTGASILSIVAFDEGMIEPTITGCLMKPLRKCQSGPPPAARAKRRSARASSQDADMPNSRLLRKGDALAGRGALGKLQGPPFAVPQCDVREKGLRMNGFGLSRGRFALLFSVMLVAAAGNTAMQSLLPAIGRELEVADIWVAVAFSLSAVVWVVMAPHLGAPGRPARAPRADAARPLRLHRLDADLRRARWRRGWRAARRLRRLHHLHGRAARSTARSARPRRRRCRPISRRGPRARRGPTRSPRSPPPSGSGRSSARRSRRSSFSRRSVSPRRSSSSPGSARSCSR